MSQENVALSNIAHRRNAEKCNIQCHDITHNRDYHYITKNIVDVETLVSLAGTSSVSSNLAPHYYSQSHLQPSSSCDNHLSSIESSISSLSSYSLPSSRSSSLSSSRSISPTSSLDSASTAKSFKDENANTSSFEKISAVTSLSLNRKNSKKTTRNFVKVSPSSSANASPLGSPTKSSYSSSSISSAESSPNLSHPCPNSRSDVPNENENNNSVIGKNCIKTRSSNSYISSKFLKSVRSNEFVPDNQEKGHKEERGQPTFFVAGGALKEESKKHVISSIGSIKIALFLELTKVLRVSLNITRLPCSVFKALTSKMGSFSCAAVDANRNKMLSMGNRCYSAAQVQLSHAAESNSWCANTSKTTSYIKNSYIFNRENSSNLFDGSLSDESHLKCTDDNNTHNTTTEHTNSPYNMCDDKSDTTRHHPAINFSDGLKSSLHNCFASVTLLRAKHICSRISLKSLTHLTVSMTHFLVSLVPVVAALVPILVALVAMAGRTHRRNVDWLSDEHLYASGVGVNPAKGVYIIFIYQCLSYRLQPTLKRSPCILLKSCSKVKLYYTTIVEEIPAD